MRLTLAGVLADAGALWRSERALLVPLAGVFYLLPMLGLVLLLAGVQLPEQASPEQLRAALTAFYEANLLAILAANLAIDFGTFAVLNLFLQGGGRTLGQVLRLTLTRFLPFLAIDLVVSILFGIGLSLLVVPGLFAFARTWLAGPAYAAASERGPLAAAAEGWRRSRGLAGVTLLGCAASIFLAAMVALFVTGGLLGLAAAALGGGIVVEAVGHLVLASIGALAWTGLALVRVAAYRRTEPRQGM